MSTRLACALVALLLACADRPGSRAARARAAPAGEAATDADVTRPLMIPPGRLAVMREAAAAKTPAWRALKANVDANLDKPGLGEAGPMNVSVAYLVTGERRYCDRLAEEARRTMATANPRADSYYVFSGITSQLAAVVSHCAPVVEPALRDEIASYLDRWTDELWFHNKGSGWGLDDPGNNYHVSFLLGTAWTGLALRSAGHPAAAKYLDLLDEKVERQLAFLAQRCAGGGWPEGTNYGEGTKGRLADLFSLLAAAGIRNAFQESEFFAAMVRYVHHQLQPGNQFLYPGGDMARESNMTASGYSRQGVQQVVYWLADSDARAAGQWYLQHVVPSYRTGFSYPQALWRDLVFGLDIPSKPQNTLPLAYRAPGDGFVSIRSEWGAAATALMASGASRIDQSHAHLDTGGFTLWHRAWQLVDAVTYSHSGLLQNAEAHNLVAVRGGQKRVVTPKGLVRFQDTERASYLQFDATGMYVVGNSSQQRNHLMQELTRELVYLKPDTIVVYDRVRPVASGTGFDWRLHFPAKPSLSGSTIRGENGGGGVTVVLLEGDPPTLAPDTDLAPDGSKTWRAQATTGTGRFLAEMRVGNGGAPSLAASAVKTTGDMEGVEVGRDVVLFSRLPFGRPTETGFSYTVPAVPGRVHTLLNMPAAVRLDVKRAGTDTVVTVSPHGDRAADVDGVIRFAEEAPR